MYTVHQHWDPLKVCVVGRSYPPEFYSWINNPILRTKFETLAQETEEDYQSLIKLLTVDFRIKVLRPDLPDSFESLYVDDRWVSPPTVPRDYFSVIGSDIWVPQIPNHNHAWSNFYKKWKKDKWDWTSSPVGFIKKYPNLKKEMTTAFNRYTQTDRRHFEKRLSFYNNIFDHVQLQGNKIIKTDLDFVTGCFVSRIGKNLYFSTQSYYDNIDNLQSIIDSRFPDTVNQIVDSQGHGDAVYCPIKPGLIVSLRDVPTYATTFPGWEVVYLPSSNYAYNDKFKLSMKHNQGRWFIPGFESNSELMNLVDFYFNDWLGQASETVFDVNILVIDEQNIVSTNTNVLLEDACRRHNITLHVSPFRHKHFWDCGIHCITNDLSRAGQQKNYF